MFGQGLLLRANGTPLMVSLPKTLVEAREWFKRNSASSSKVELCDVHVLEKSPGVLEYTSAIYDACPEFDDELKPNKCLAPYIVYGDVLVFKTTVSRTRFDDMVDVIECLPLRFDQVRETLSRFHTDLCRVNGAAILAKNGDFSRGVASCKMFPQLFGSQVKKKMVYHTGLPSQDCDTFPSNVMPVDLLTWSMKYRGFTEGMGTFATDPRRSEEAHKAFKNNRAHVKNDIGICFVCKGLCRQFCSKCMGYYWCGESACKKDAWKLHKPSCKKPDREPVAREDEVSRLRDRNRRLLEELAQTRLEVKGLRKEVEDLKQDRRYDNT